MKYSLARRMKKFHDILNKKENVQNSIQNVLSFMYNKRKENIRIFVIHAKKNL